MKNRKTGELFEIFGDFWLGMAGAAASGLSEFSQKRREDKNKKANDKNDFFTRASQAFVKTAEEAQKVAKTTSSELAK